jgi:hypothetical protein
VREACLLPNKGASTSTTTFPTPDTNPDTWGAAGPNDLCPPTSVSRLNALHSLLMQTVAFLETYHSPGNDTASLVVGYIGISVDLLGPLLHSLALLSRLSTLRSIDEPGWDTRAARRTANVFGTFDAIIEVVERVRQGSGIREDAEGIYRTRMGFFQKAVLILKVIKAMFQAAMAEETTPEPEGAGKSAEDGGGPGLQANSEGLDFADEGTDPMVSGLEDIDFAAMSSEVMSEAWIASLFSDFS